MKAEKYHKLMKKLYRSGAKGCSLHGLKLTQAKKGYLKNRNFVFYVSDGYVEGMQQYRLVLSPEGMVHCEQMGIE